ncbi:ABC transporter permease [Kitasatospora cystarginea]|uniref:ABC transporter permease n=1 Tax=Kitasatospora cystarginea TaxID=58350 RepID=A0ABP5Q9K9_9ACTN
MVGFVVRRLRGRLLPAFAAMLTVLIATASLTALTAFNRSVGEAGLRHALQGPGFSRTVVLVRGHGGVGARAAEEAAVARLGRGLFAPLPDSVRSVAVSRSFALPGAPVSGAAGANPDITHLASLDRSKARLLAGQWPQAATAATAPIEAAVPQAALDRLHLTPSALPAVVNLVDRYDGTAHAVRITGVYQAVDRDGPYWKLDELGGRGVQIQSFTTYGPLLVDDTAFTAAALAQDGRNYLLAADFGALRAADAEALRERAGHLALDGLQVETELPEFLGELESDRMVARSTLLIGLLQLAVLAIAVLLLVVHLLTTRQIAENALLAARGASRLRIGALTAAEAALLALPAALLAPPLTPLLVRLLADWGPLADTRLNTALPWTSWPPAAACALGCVLLAAVPALLRSAGSAALRRAGRRRALVAGAARSGADLALLALAAVAYQQLAHYSGGGLSKDRAGRLGIDPLLVVAPTLALTAGTVLVLRLLPLVARLGERLAELRPGLEVALLGWQFARRPGRSAGPVLLLVLAVSIGMLALGQRTAWSGSQGDQADFATASGLRISNSGLASMGQGGRYAALPGGDRLIPVVRKHLMVPGGNDAQLLALDAAAAARSLRIRPDVLGGRAVADLFGPLAGSVPAGPQAGIVLPGRPRRIDLDLSLTLSGQAAASQGPGVILLLRDRFGVLYEERLPELPVTGDRTVSVDLGPELGAPLGSAAAPLTVAGIQVTPTPAQEGWLNGELTLHRISAADSADGPATAAAVPAGLGWSVRTGTGQQDQASSGGTAGTDGHNPLVFRYRTGSTSQGTSSLIPADAQGHPAPVPELTGIATRGYLTAVGASVGDRILVPVGGAAVGVRITAAVAALPTADGPALAVDLAALDRSLVDQQSLPSAPDEWWLPGTGRGDAVPARAAAALRAGAGAQTLQLRDEVAAALRDDPIGAAPQNALAALAAAAAVLAAIGFAAAAAGAAAERAGEFAVLLALGASRRRLARTVAAEQGLLVLLGLGVGLGLGALLAHLVLPLIVLSPAARRPVPGVLVHLPLGQAVLMALLIAALPLLVLLGPRRNRDLTARLRYVEET